jgi:hypothetical protein
MKKIYAAILFALVTSISNAQTASAVVFAEAGEKFTLFLNGDKQNATPQSNVKLTGLTSEFYQARVDFEDPKLADFANNNFAVQMGIESTYMIKVNKKGEYVLRFQSQAPISGAASATPSPSSSTSEARRIAVVDDEPVEHNVEMKTDVDGMEEVGGTTTITQTTTTKSTANPTKSGENVSIGMNVGGLNMGMNVNVTDTSGDMDMDIQENSSTTVTTTTTSKTTTTTPTKPVQAKPAPAPQPVVEQSVGRCASSMSPSSFVGAKTNISSKSFEDSKMTVAKQVTKANCMTAAQIAEVMALFSFEESKLDYAKYAYDFCYNQGDYYVINDAFTFESSIEELNKFLESK